MKEKLPNTNAVIALGIISICTCFMYGVIGLTCGIISFVLAKKSIRLFEESPETYDENSYNTLKTGRICAIIGISLSGLAMLLLVAYLVTIFSLITGSIAAGL